MPVMLGTWLRGGLRLLPWLLLLGGLALSGWWRYYLAPRHMPYLWTGLAVLALVLLLSELDGLLARRAKLRLAVATRSPLPPLPRPPSLPDWLETGVHWLPLLLLLVLGPTTLTLRGGAPSSQQLSRLRGQVGGPVVVDEPVPTPLVVSPSAPSTAVDSVIPAEPVAAAQVERLRAETAAAATKLERMKSRLESEAAETARKPVAGHLAPEQAAQRLREAAASLPDSPGADPANARPAAEPRPNYAQTDLVKLFMGRGGPLGNPVELIGRLHKVVGDDPVVPLGVDSANVELVLYRYAIFCCVADAVPATAILEGLDSAQVQDEQWVRLRGRLHQTGATGDIPLLKVDSFEAIAEPKEPYLFTDPGEF